MIIKVKIINKLDNENFNNFWLNVFFLIKYKKIGVYNIVK